MGQEDRMLSVQFEKPVISLDMTQNRVRVYKCTLRLLGYPQYIQLLYNAAEHRIGVQGYREKPKHQWHKVRYDKLSPKNPYEISSKYLTDILRSAIPTDSAKGAILRVPGMLHRKQKLAVFQLADARPVSAEEECEVDES